MVLVNDVITPYDVVHKGELFSLKFLKILSKENELIPFHWNAIQRDFHKNRTGRDIILKARQMGISSYVQAEIYRRLVTKSTSALTLTHLDKTTQIFRERADRFYKYCKFNDIQPERKFDNASFSTFPEFDSSHYIGTAGNKDTGRGGTYTDIHLSEAAFFPDLKSILAGAMQGGNPDVVIESTANGAQGYFYELCLDALAGRNRWKLHFYPWYAHSEYAIYDDEVIIQTEDELKLGLSDAQIKWRRDKQMELGRLFPQEYPENVAEAFLTSGRGYFSDISDDFYQAPFGQLPEAGHLYSAGVDWGQSNDYTCMIVVDRTKRKMVDYLHLNHMAWKLMRMEIVKMARKWNIAILRPEMNSIGSVNAEELISDGLELDPFTMTNQSKNQIFQRLHEELEQGFQLMNWQLLRSEMNSLTSKQTQSGLWTISAEGEAHDDIPVTLALAITSKVKHNRQARAWSNN